jgi:5-methylcytosine-specific restriction endonuclease McrA
MSTIKRSSRWKYVRKMAWDRDRKANAPCHICGMAIDYHIEPSTTPDSWEPDHVYPVSKRPDLELDLDNIEASHMRCNRARGDGGNGENVLGRQSRIW